MNNLIYFIFGLLTSLLFPPYFFLPLGFIIFPSLCFLLDSNKENYTNKNIFNKFSIFGLGFFISYLIIGGDSFITFWEIFTKDATVLKSDVQEYYIETRQNILMFCLMANLLLFYFSFFMFKIDNFSKGLVFITLVLAAISMLFIY